MERCSGTQASEGTPVDPVAEWAAPGGETGLEEPTWPLGRRGGPEAYPVRPDEPDCIYFVRTGFCGYGNRCRFNHPRDRNLAIGSLRTSGGDYPERTGQPVCQYYMRTGMCKFGSTCKYHHPKYGFGSSAPNMLNFNGYPSRPGEKDCSHYMKTGLCSFGVMCKFHHPRPAGIQLPSPGTGLAAPPAGSAPTVYPNTQFPSLQTSQQYGLITGNWPIARPAIIPGSYVPGNYGPMVLPHGVIPVSGWAPYPAPMASPSTQTPVGGGPIYGITQLSPPSTSYTGQYIPMPPSIGQSSSSYKEHTFPKRPGQPDCQYYLRTGDCKFGSTCKYNHSRGSTAATMNLSLSPMGLSLHPGTSICSHYAQSGICRYGPACRFDHSIGTMGYSPSASSLTDMPVAPYSVGSTTATLAPSSSSLDVRPEHLSGPQKDSVPPKMPAVSGSSTSVGSILSKGGPAPGSGAQHSGQGSASSG